MEFTEGLKKNIDFGKVYRKGKSRANRQLVLYILSNGTDKNRLGISVSKKVGNSVRRNRARRLMRTDAAGKIYEEIEKSVLHISDLMGISI